MAVQKSMGSNTCYNLFFKYQKWERINVFIKDCYVNYNVSIQWNIVLFNCLETEAWIHEAD